MSGMDQHSSCVQCLGREHAVKGLKFKAAYCAQCGYTPERYLKKRLKHFERGTRTPQTAETTAIPPEAPPTSAPPTLEREGDPPSPRRDSWGDQADEEDPIQIDGIVDREFEPLYAHNDDEEEEYGEDDRQDDREEEESSRSDDSSSSSSGEGEEALPTRQPSSDAGPSQAPPQQQQEAPTTSATATTVEGLEIYDVEIQDLFRRATDRLNIPWPQQEDESDPEEDCVFDGLGTAEKKPVKHVVPLMPSTIKQATASWKKPFSKPSTAYKHPNCAGMRDRGFESLPPVERGIAEYLLSKTPPASQDCFVDGSDKEFAGLNRRAFTELATTLKALNGVGLLAGSATHVFRAAKDAPTKEQMAELRRLNNEVLNFARTAIQATGRNMALHAVMERSRWLDVGNIDGAHRKVCLDQPMPEAGGGPVGLLGSAMETLTAKYKQQKEEGEVLKAYLPKKASFRPPPPPPPPRYSRQPAPAASGGSRRPSSQPPPPQASRAEYRGPSRDRQGPRRRGPSPSPARGGHRGGRRGDSNKRPRT